MPGVVCGSIVYTVRNWSWCASGFCPSPTALRPGAGGALVQVLWEILYADDLVLIADTQEECISGMESKGLRVNMKRTEFLVSGACHDVLNNMASTPVLSVVVVSATTPSSAHSACCGSTRSAVATLSEWWPTQTMSVLRARLGPSMEELWLKWVSTVPCLMWKPLSDTYVKCSGGDCDSAIADRCCVA